MRGQEHYSVIRDIMVSSFLVTGRADHVTGLLNACEPPMTGAKDSPNACVWERMQLLHEIRGSLLKMDAKLVLDLAKRMRLRFVHNERLRRNDPVVAWLPDVKKWQSGFRFISDSGRNMVLGKETASLKCQVTGLNPLLEKKKTNGSQRRVITVSRISW